MGSGLIGMGPSNKYFNSAISTTQLTNEQSTGIAFTEALNSAHSS